MLNISSIISGLDKDLTKFNITGTSYSEYIVPLPATTDDYFGFRVPHNGSATTNYPYAFIDDVFYL